MHDGRALFVFQAAWQCEHDLGADDLERHVLRQQIDDVIQTVRWSFQIMPRGRGLSSGEDTRRDLIVHVMTNVDDIAGRASSEDQPRRG